jgi:hypothetical protein
MSTPAGLAIAVFAALGSACAFGVGVALQHRQIQRERGHGPLGSLSRLARRRLWLAGTGLAVAAGVIFGMTAAVTLSIARIIRFGDTTAVLTHWQP